VTAQEMIDIWRDLVAMETSVQAGSTWQTSDDGKDEVTFTFVDVEGSKCDTVGEGQDVDPLKAFEQAYTLYKQGYRRTE